MSKTVILAVLVVVNIIVFIFSWIYTPKLLKEFKNKASTQDSDGNDIIDINLGDYWTGPCTQCFIMLLSIGLIAWGCGSSEATSADDSK
jgi:hypothetical protein